MQGLQELSSAMANNQTIEVPVEVSSTKPIKNHPTAVICRNEDIFIDPTCMDSLDKCQFIIYRYERAITLH